VDHILRPLLRLQPIPAEGREDSRSAWDLSHQNVKHLPFQCWGVVEEEFNLFTFGDTHLILVTHV
jgi:hypothetical protein